MIYTLLTRQTLGVSVLHDRNPIFVQMSDGGLRNGYTVRVLNKRTEPRTFELRLVGLPGAELQVIGGSARADGAHAIEVGPDQTREVRVLVTRHGRLPSSAQSVGFEIRDPDGGETATASDHFRGP
jgi:polyferredoxin